MANKKGKDQWVVLHNGAWAVRGEGNMRVTKCFDTQKEAIAYAEEIAGNQNSDVIIQNREGKIRKHEHGKEKIAEPAVEECVEVCEEPIVEECVDVCEEPIVEECADVCEEPIVEECADVCEEPIVEECVDVCEEPIDEECIEATDEECTED